MTSSSPVFHQRKTVAQRILKAVIPLFPSGLRVRIYKLCARVSPFIYGPVTWNVFRLPFGLVLKVTVPFSVEADALRFVNSVGGVHAPLLIDSIQTVERSYMLSTWFEGQRLGDVWDDMTSADKERVTMELREQFSHLRSRTMSPTHLICNAGGGPIDDPRIPWVMQENPRVFDSGTEFAKEVWVGLNASWNRDTLRPILQPLIEREDVPVVFNHGDLIPRNVIVPRGLSRWRSGSEPVCIVDWEYAGWMPTYWDPLKATWVDYEENSEWIKIVRGIYPDCSVELDADWEWRCRSRITII